MHIRMLALDIDGTLLTSDGEIHASTPDALMRAETSGIRIVIATGRRYRRAVDVLRSRPIGAPMIALGGALTKDESENTLFAHTFSPAELADATRVLREHGQSAVAQRDSHGRGGPDCSIDAAAAWNEPTRLYADKNPGAAIRVDDILATELSDTLVIGAFGDEEGLRAAAAALERAYPGRYRTSIVPAGIAGPACYCEIVRAEVSKWSALAALAATLGIAAADGCCGGDEVNDLPMIQAAGFGVAMGNAREEVKRAANWVTRSNDDGGIAATVDHILG